MSPAPDLTGPDIASGRQGASARPQADFGAPIDIGPGPRNADTDTVGDDPEPTQHGGYVPPLFAMADDEAEPQPVDPPRRRALTERISQGRPSHSEPDPHIAGVVGRIAPGDDAPDA